MPLHLPSDRPAALNAFFDFLWQMHLKYGPPTSEDPVPGLDFTPPDASRDVADTDHPEAFEN